MPRFAPNKMPQEVRRRYFELIRTGLSGSKAATAVGVSLSCGSNWFIDAGSVTLIDEAPISSRYFSQDDRIEIAEGLDAGERVKAIAARIGKSFQSVYREIARNRKPDGPYQPWFAHNQAFLRRRKPKPHILAADATLGRLVAGKLTVRWSPGQISRWLRRRYPRRVGWHVCAETIYEAVYQSLVVVACAPLRTGRTYRHKRGRGRSRDGAMKQSTAMKSIHDRPAAVADRRQVGHWEGDLIIGAGQRSAIATLIERKTRTTVLVHLPGGHTAQEVGDALVGAFAIMPSVLRRTLTWDQGNEMFQHARIEAEAGLKIYFADPHSPWQRGSNENTNGLLRQYFPKGTDLSVHTATDLKRVAAELNDRPRLCLGDRTPTQTMRPWNRQARTPAIRDVR